MSAFDSLLIHTCTVQLNTPGAGSSSGYGHGTDSWAAIATGLRCRLMPAPTTRQWQAEIERAGQRGVVLSDHMLFMDYDDAPAALKAIGTGTTRCRITNVLAENGDTVDAGSFDIQYVSDEAGAGHHLRLALKRTA